MGDRCLSSVLLHEDPQHTQQGRVERIFEWAGHPSDRSENPSIKKMLDPVADAEVDLLDEYANYVMFIEAKVRQKPGEKARFQRDRNMHKPDLVRESSVARESDRQGVHHGPELKRSIREVEDTGAVDLSLNSKIKYQDAEKNLQKKNTGHLRPLDRRSLDTVFIPGQVHTAMILCIPATFPLRFFGLRVALLVVALAGLSCPRSELSPTTGRTGGRVRIDPEQREESCDGN